MLRIAGGENEQKLKNCVAQRKKKSTNCAPLRTNLFDKQNQNV